jgi:predicted ATPase/DNA-binding winged helix-turn-helix (wHTH) protein
MKRFESYGLDTLNECLWKDGAQIALPPKPFAVLRYLVENPGRLITHDELLDALWPETYVQPQVLRTYVLDLRKALNDDARQPRFIRTIPKRGFRFVAAVTEDALGERGDSSRGAEAPLVGGPQAGIVDRKDELARLDAHLRKAIAGHRQVVFVTGEPGIGKTALADVFCAQAARSPAVVARGQCVQGFGKENHYPVLEALGQVCSSSGGETACRILARMAPAWLAALGRAGESVSEPRAAFAGDGRTLSDLCAALEELADGRPLILVIEDIQWADAATLDLVSALARRRAPACLMLLVTSSTVNAPASPMLNEVKQDLVVRRLSAEISLAPLRKAAFKELLSRQVQHEPLPPGLTDFVHRRSEGNPLFGIAIMEHLVAQRLLVRKEANGVARWEQKAPFDEMGADVPGELARMAELDIARLADLEQRVLEAGSLMSVAFAAWQVAAALEQDVAEIEEVCDALARRLYFVNRAGEDELPGGERSAFYTLAHELYRDVLYRRQSPARRSARHIRIAERMGEIFAGRVPAVAREMAAHFEAAGSWRSAVESLRAAARHACGRNAPAEAVELLEFAQRLAENLSEAERNTMTREIGMQMRAMHLDGAQEAELQLAQARKERLTDSERELDDILLRNR